MKVIYMDYKLIKKLKMKKYKCTIYKFVKGYYLPEYKTYEVEGKDQNEVKTKLFRYCELVYTKDQKTVDYVNYSIDSIIC